MKSFATVAIFLSVLQIIVSVSVRAQSPLPGSDDYLNWTAAQAAKIGKSMRERGSAGGYVDLRIISTNKAINYQMRATLMTPEVIRAAARVAQLKDRLSVDQTRKIVEDAEAAGDLVVMIEINPTEGSGVIPLDWRVFLQPKGLPANAVGAMAGIKAPHLRKAPALSGLYGRDFEYDVFWVVCPLVDERKIALIPADTAEIQLVVGIYEREARISWKTPESIRQKIRLLSKK